MPGCFKQNRINKITKRNRYNNTEMCNKKWNLSVKFQQFLSADLMAVSLLEVLIIFLTPTVLVATIDAQWEGMGDVGSARYEPALLPPCPTIRVLSYSN